jgi:hypothetical protein
MGESESSAGSGSQARHAVAPPISAPPAGGGGREGEGESTTAAVRGKRWLAAAAVTAARVAQTQGKF